MEVRGAPSAKPAQPTNARRVTGKGARVPVMKDVATLSGVSHQTVSRVVNGLSNVSDGTRARVLEAMQQLSYHPNSAARALVTNRTRSIGVIGTNTALFGPASNLLWVVRAADAAGYSVSVAHLADSSTIATERAGIRFADQSVDGIILMEPVHTAKSSFLARRMPVVVLGRHMRRGLPSVTYDNVGGARLAAEHLLDLGHETVWHVAGPLTWTAAIDRMSGWKAALQDRGRPVPEISGGDWTAKSGYNLGIELARNQNVTAIFASNDEMALGVVRALVVSGRRVPEDVSVVGFDNMPETEFVTPPLTTVRQDYELAANKALEMLVALLEGRRPSIKHVELGNDLVLRASTAPPRSTGGRDAKTVHEEAQLERRRTEELALST